MKKIYMAGSGGMLGEAFYQIFNNDAELKCTDIDVNDNWLSYLDFRNNESYINDVNNYKPDWLFHLGAFTVPSERGTWIMAYSISYILKYLKEKTQIKKILLIIHPSTPGAKQFFERVGFNIMNDCAPNGLFIWLINKVNFFAK